MAHGFCYVIGEKSPLRTEPLPAGVGKVNERLWPDYVSHPAPLLGFATLGLHESACECAPKTALGIHLATAPFSWMYCDRDHWI